MIGNITKQRNNIYFYILNVIVCCVIFTACGAQETGMDNLAEQSEEAQTNLFNSEAMNVTGKDDTEDWDLSEEQLYWIDHEERVTVLENPTRRFVEIRAIDTERVGADDGGLMPYFGMLKEADYEVTISDDGPVVEVNFSFAEGPLEAGYETSLYNGKVMEMNYIMTVTDQESGRVLQEDTVRLCIDQVDMITFGDLNKDRYIDMQIDYPTHQDETYRWKHWDNPFRRFWNPEKGIFADVPTSSLYNNIKKLTEEEQKEKTKREKPDIFAPLTQLPEGADPDNYIELTGEGCTEYVVQPGDCLWNISERFLGSGIYWTMLEREENAPEDPDYLLPGELVRIPEKIYIRKDPYSRGGLRSGGSFQIEMPDGFQYYFLAEGVLFNRWSDENSINCLPITNEMGENALSEDWEAFQAEVIRCSEEICPGKVSNLQFEKYAVKGGCDLYGYSFEYDAGDEVIEYTHFIRLGAANMTEVIGVGKKEPNTVLLNTTRYIAASFIDYGGEPTMGWGREMGPNVGAADWNYPLLHNLFAAAKEEFE